MTELLIIALHARALTQSARRGGHNVAVIDLYNDRDTRVAATRCRKTAEREGRFDAAALIESARDFCPPPAPLLAGCGFEDDPALLETLAHGRALYGNTPETVALMKDPRQFFPLLATLAIPHPEVAMTVPAETAGWLMKRIGSHGGADVRPATIPANDPIPANEKAEHYFQRHVAGQSASVLFLANRRQARVIGFNTQFSTEIDGSPYWYAGAINRIEMRHKVRGEIARKLDTLVAACGLQGLNSLDFVVSGDDYRVLEVNPRPSATMDLYDADFAGGLVDWHLRAIAGELPVAAPVGAVRGHAVIYADGLLRIKPRFRFPDWCSDIPHAGAAFGRGAPVCTVHAEGSSAAQVWRLIEQRRQILQSTLQSRLMDKAA